MTEPNRSAVDLASQLRRHLESLRGAGVEWLPVAPPVAAAATPVALPVLPAGPASLFDEPPAPASGPTLSLEQRRAALAALAARVAACVRCPHLAATRTQTVFGVGPLDPDLCFIGEAPGETEDAQGEPFVGVAGQLLDRIIAAMGMRRNEIFICNILRCRPPGNRLPNAEEASNCREWLEQTLELVRPRIVCALGGCAAQNLLGSTLGIGRLRGRFHDYKGIPVLCTYHPAFLLPHRSPERKKDVWEDMKKLLARMGRPVPGQK
jgi:DNA polymerase